MADEARQPLGIAVALIPATMLLRCARRLHACRAAAGSYVRTVVSNASLLRGRPPWVRPRPNTVVVRDRRGRKRGLERRRGARGLAGPPGPAGPAGAIGPRGPVGISGYEIVARSVRTPNWRVVTISCPRGKHAIRGGAEALGQYAILNRSTPGPGGTGWVAVGHSETTSETSNGINIFAICAVVQ
jgi:hypothetical protein